MMSLLSRVGRRAVQSSVRPIRLHHERLRVDLERNIVGQEFQAADEDHGVGSIVEHEGRVAATALVVDAVEGRGGRHGARIRSEEHPSELQSLTRISYAVLCLKKQKKTK